MALKQDYSILAVDDTEIILALLKSQLESEGYTVTTVDDADKAIALISEVHFDLILLDIEMPKFTGVQLLQFIKQTATNMETPVVMLTAQSDPENVNQCLNNGANDYILKPFNMVSVKQRVWKILNKADS